MLEKDSKSPPDLSNNQKEITLSYPKGWPEQKLVLLDEYTQFLN
jgi:hypothetical protein